MRRPSQFDQFLTARITIRKPDGRVFENVPASLQSESVFIDDVSIPLEVGDQFERQLPSGVLEQFEITDPGYHEAFHGLPASYQAKHRRLQHVKPRTEPTINVTYNLHGPNSRVNIESSDNSVNIQASQDSLFDDMRDFVRAQLPETEHDTLLALVDEMDHAANTPGFRDKYLKFVGVAADHLGVLAPFLPLLTGLLNR